MSDFVNIRKRAAGKEHICSLCKDPITRGTQYYNYSGRYDGRFFAEKYHPACLRIVLKYGETSYDGLYSDDEVYAWAQETACQPCEKYDSCFDSCFRCAAALERLGVAGGQGHETKED